MEVLIGPVVEKYMIQEEDESNRTLGIITEIHIDMGALTTHDMTQHPIREEITPHSSNNQIEISEIEMIDMTIDQLIGECRSLTNIPI